VVGHVALGLVSDQLYEVTTGVGGDDLLEQRARAGPELVTATACFALRPAVGPRQRLGGETVAAESDAALAGGLVMCRCDNAATGCGLDLAQHCAVEQD
jgi:hypothetical protein